MPDLADIAAIHVTPSEIVTLDEGYRQLAFAILLTAMRDYVRGDQCGTRCVTKFSDVSKHVHRCAARAYDWLCSVDAAHLMDLLGLDRQAFLRATELRAIEYRQLSGSPDFEPWKATYFPDGF